LRPVVDLLFLLGVTIHLYAVSLVCSRNQEMGQWAEYTLTAAFDSLE